MNNQQARIKLATAQGWKRIPDDELDASTYPYYWIDGKGAYQKDVPDPYTDANDDYRVLEWARNEWLDIMGAAPEWAVFVNALLQGVDTAMSKSWTSYRIGDYARAALKVIDDE